MASQLVEAWRMSCECNRFLLGEIPSSSFGDRYAPRTRTVAAQFAHMHNVRLRWLKHAAPDLVGACTSFPRGADPSQAELGAALLASELAVAEFLQASESTGVVPSWDGPPATFLGYLTAHEAHHRALVIIAARLSGHRLPKEVTYGQWQWGKKRSLRKAAE